MRLAYYPGCTMKTDAVNFDESTYSTAEALGIELLEPTRWNCCGTVHALAKDNVMNYLAPIRNLIRVEQMNEAELVDDKRVVTQCAMCYNTLKRANEDAKADPDKMGKIRDVMEKEPNYQGSVDVIHMLELIKGIGWDEVKSKVVKPLDGLKVSPYYGCLLLRPREYGIDDPDHPRVMEDLFEALGAEVVDNPFKSKCCGAYHAVHMKEVAAELSYRILRQAQEAGADIIVTACPLCQFNLGDRQDEIKRHQREFEGIPVVYYTQLMALAFGKEGTGFEQNVPDPVPVLEERGQL